MNFSTISQRAKFFGSLLTLFVFFSSNLFAVDFLSVVYREVQIGTTLVYPFYADYVASPPELEYHNIAPPQHGDVWLDYDDATWWYGGKFSGSHEFQYTPTVLQPQRDTVYLWYQRLDPATNLLDTYMDVVIIDIVPRSIFATNDYIETKTDVPVSIPVLDNDNSDYSFSIDFVSLCNNGDWALNAQGDSIIFTPDPLFYGVAAFEYTTCNTDGFCDDATVFVGVDGEVSDTVYYDATIYQPTYIYDALSAYDLVTPPSNGTLSSNPLGGLIYKPNDIGSSFVEEIKFDSSGIEKVFQIRVTDVSAPQILTKDDNYWIPEKRDFNFFVNSNDLIPSMSVAIVSSPTYGETQHITGSEYNYDVFDDVVAKKKDAFTYRAAAFNWAMIEYAKINVHIDEFTPKITTYNLTTKKDQPLILEYKTFFDHTIGLSEAVSPNIGDLQFVKDSFTWNNQTCYGDTMVVFTPPSGVADDTARFELKYDPGNGNEYLIKVDVNILDEVAPADEECIGSNCVWPGDINNNGIVDARDLLPLAYGIGKKGLIRANPGIDWGGQYSESWGGPLMAMDLDYKFLDADGNGKIMASDTLAIIENYNKENSIYPERSPGMGNVNVTATYGEGEVLQSAPIVFDPSPYFDTNPINTGDGYSVGDIILMDVLLGVQEQPAENIHGIAFTLGYDTQQMDSTSVSIYFDNKSWFTMNSTVMTMTQSPLNGFLDAAISRTSGDAISGFGKVGLAEFIIIIDIDGIKSDKTSYTFTTQGIDVMNGDGEIIHYPPTKIEVPIHTGGTEQVPATLLAYPNPSSGYFNLHLNGGMDKIIQSYQVFDLNGRMIHQMDGLNEKSTVVNMNNQASGLYVVNVVTTKGEVLSQKIEIVD